MNDQKREIEKRAYPRFPSTRIVLIQLSEGGEETAEASGREAEVRDISRGGVRLLTDLELQEAQILKLYLSVPGMADLPPQTVEVRWIVTGPPGETFQVGVQFLN